MRCELRSFAAVGGRVATNGNAGVFKKELAHLLFCEAIATEGFYMLRAQDHNGFVPAAEPVAPDRCQRLANGAQNGFTALGGVFADSARRLGSKQAQRALLTAQAALHVKRLPGALFL